MVQRDREFNADVSHELRTPLAVIRGATELLLSRPELDERMQARLRRIQRAEQQCTDLISALLLLSRNERGHGATDVSKVAEQLLDMHRAQLGGKPLVLRMEGAGRPDRRCAGSRGRGRARQPHRQRGEVHAGRRGHRAHAARCASKSIDSGPGLSAEEAARLFERGYRGTHAEHSQGAGIGLSIVRRLCALYGWDVRVGAGRRAGGHRDARVRRRRALIAVDAYASTQLQPPVRSVGLAGEQAEEQLLHAARHRAGAADADLAAVDRADRRDFRRRAAHEELVAQVEVFARDVALDHLDAVVARERG